MDLCLREQLERKHSSVCQSHVNFGATLTVYSVELSHPHQQLKRRMSSFQEADQVTNGTHRARCNTPEQTPVGKDGGILTDSQFDSRQGGSVPTLS
jgi:hypothetical protein